MTDRDLQTFNESITNFSELESNILDQRNYKINDQVSLVFLENNKVIINLYDSFHEIDRNYFIGIINELKNEKKVQIRTKNHVNIAAKKNEIYHVADDCYLIFEEYLEDLFYIRQIASFQLTYIDKLLRIVNLFRGGKSLIIGASSERVFTSIDEFVDEHLKGLYGFVSLENELQ